MNGRKRALLTTCAFEWHNKRGTPQSMLCVDNKKDKTAKTMCDWYFFLNRAWRHFSFLKRSGRHQKGAGRRALQKRPRQNTEIYSIDLYKMYYDAWYDVSPLSRHSFKAGMANAVSNHLCHWVQSLRCYTARASRSPIRHWRKDLTNDEKKCNSFRQFDESIKSTYFK